MARFTHIQSWLVLSSLICSTLAPLLCARAQITPDNTLGAESSQVVPKGDIDQIDGGALRDRNQLNL